LQWAWAYFTYEHGARIITPISHPAPRQIPEKVPLGGR
jgi:hypothetical protein